MFGLRHVMCSRHAQWLRLGRKTLRTYKRTLLSRTPGTDLCSNLNYSSWMVHSVSCRSTSNSPQCRTLMLNNFTCNPNKILAHRFHTSLCVNANSDSLCMENALVREYTEHCVRMCEEAERVLSQGGGTDGLTASRTLMEMKPVADRVNEYHRMKREIEELAVLVKEDKEMADLGAEEIKVLQAKTEEVEGEILSLLVPIEIADDSDIVIELSAGAGGLEAMLFAHEIFTMYENYALYRGWEFTVIDKGMAELGAMRSASASISGESVYQTMKFEAGTHRVQRVPKTENKGRVHTSTMSVVIYPQPKEIDVVVDRKDLKIDTFKASGPGGQHVNTTDSAVRITHLPTGIVSACQEGRSQIKNRETAMKKLVAKIYQKQLDEQFDHINSQRKLQTGSRARSDKIRTYNFPQDRITDHRIGKSMFNMDSFLAGGEGLDEMVNALQEESASERLWEKLKQFNESDKSERRIN